MKNKRSSFYKKMKNKMYYIYIFLISVCSFAQNNLNPKDISYYADEYFTKVPKQNATYIFLKTKNENGYYIESIYYISGKPFVETYFKDKNQKIKNRENFYYNEGTIRSVNIYDEDGDIKESKTYRKNGLLKGSAIINKEINEAIFLEYYSNENLKSKEIIKPYFTSFPTQGNYPNIENTYKEYYYKNGQSMITSPTKNYYILINFNDSQETDSIDDNITLITYLDTKNKRIETKHGIIGTEGNYKIVFESVFDLLGESSENQIDNDYTQNPKDFKFLE